MERATSPNVQETLGTGIYRVDLTEEEKRDLAENIADDQLELEKLEGEKSSITKDYASRIEAVRARIKASSSTYRQGFEMREVDHVEKKDFDLGTCTLIRLDTGEIIKARKLTNAEQESHATRLPIDIPHNDYR